MGMVGAAVGSAVVGGVMSKDGEGQASSSNAYTSPFRLQGNGSLFSGSGYDGTNVNQMMGQPMQDLSQLGIQGSRMFGQQALNNQHSNQMFGLGQGFLDQASVDPMQMQNTLYQQQAGLMQPQFEQQQLAQEGRLFKQGRLGRSGGADQQQALLQSQNNTFGQMLANSFQQSQQMQQNQVRMGAGLMSGAQGLQGGYQQLGANSLNMTLGIQDSMNSALNTGANMAGRTETTGATGPSALGNIGTGLMTSGLDRLFQGGGGGGDFTNTDTTASIFQTGR